MTAIAPTTFVDSTPPTHSPWGKPHGWSMVIPGVWSCHTASHGGWWLSPERLEAMPADLKAQTFGSSGQWYEEDSDWALVVRAFPDEFSEEMRCHAETDRIWRERSAKLDAARTDNDICSALQVRPEDFQPSAQALAAQQAALEALVIVQDRAGRLAIVRGYTRAREQASADTRYAQIADCIDSGLDPALLEPGCHAARCYRTAENHSRWCGPWLGDAPPTIHG